MFTNLNILLRDDSDGIVNLPKRAGMSQDSRMIELLMKIEGVPCFRKDAAEGSLDRGEEGEKAFA